MWKKQTYQIDKGGTKESVTGSVCGCWGIDKRENQYYVLTHVPTGFFVDSSRTATFLKKMVDCPEFAEYDGMFGHHDNSKLITRIQSFRNEYGWK